VHWITDERALARAKRDAEGSDDLGRAHVTIQNTGTRSFERRVEVSRLRRDSPECARAQARETRAPRGLVQRRAA